MSSTITTIADFTKLFPPIPNTIVGEPAIDGIVDATEHLHACAITSKTSISNLGYLWLVYNKETWANISTEAYPSATLSDPELPSDYYNPPPLQHDGIDANDRLNDQNKYDNQKKKHEEVNNMNAALVARLKKMLDSTYVTEYATHCLQSGVAHPTLLYMLKWLSKEYGTTTSTDRTNNTKRMEASWNPDTGFATLLRQLAKGQHFADMANRPIYEDDVVDMGEQLIVNCGRYGDLYEQWLQEQDRSLDNFRTWWREKLRIRRLTGQSANSLGYGMNAAQVAEQEAASEQLLQETAARFAAGHAANAEAMANVTNSNNAVQSLAQQVQMLCQVVQQNQAPAYQAPAYQAPYQAPYQTQYQGQGRGGGGRRGGGRAGRNGGRGTTGGRYQQAAQQLPTVPSNIKRFENNNYCWTHGCDVNDNHTSMTCERQAPGHNIYATRANPMGGNMKCAHKTILPSQVGRPPAPTRAARRQQAAQPPMQQPPMQQPPMQQPVMQQPIMQWQQPIQQRAFNMMPPVQAPVMPQGQVQMPQAPVMPQGLVQMPQAPAPPMNGGYGGFGYPPM